MIGVGFVDADMIKLRNRQVDHMLPAAAAILAAPEATVIGFEDEVGIVRRDPHIVMVGVGGVGRVLEALASVIAEQQNQVTLE
jgi:hypothetical protein